MKYTNPYDRALAVILARLSQNTTSSADMVGLAQALVSVQSAKGGTYRLRVDASKSAPEPQGEPQDVEEPRAQMGEDASSLEEDEYGVKAAAQGAHLDPPNVFGSDEPDHIVAERLLHTPLSELPISDVLGRPVPPTPFPYPSASSSYPPPPVGPGHD